MLGSILNPLPSELHATSVSVILAWRFCGISSPASRSTGNCNNARQTGQSGHSDSLRLRRPPATATRPEIKIALGRFAHGPRHPLLAESKPNRTNLNHRNVFAVLVVRPLRPAKLPQEVQFRVRSPGKVVFSAVLGVTLPIRTATVSSLDGVFRASASRPQVVEVIFICTPVIPSCFNAKKHNRFEVKLFFPIFAQCSPSSCVILPSVELKN